MARLLAYPISSRIMPSWKFSRGNFVLTLSVVRSLGPFAFSLSRTEEFSTASLTCLPKIMEMEFRSAASYVQHSSLSAVLIGLGFWKRAYIINFVPMKRENSFNLLTTRLLSISCSKGCGQFDFPWISFQEADWHHYSDEVSSLWYIVDKILVRRISHKFVVK